MNRIKEKKEEKKFVIILVKSIMPRLIPEQICHADVADPRPLDLPHANINNTCWCQQYLLTSTCDRSSGPGSIMSVRYICPGINRGMEVHTYNFSCLKVLTKKEKNKNLRIYNYHLKSFKKVFFFFWWFYVI